MMTFDSKQRTQWRVTRTPHTTLSAEVLCALLACCLLALANTVVVAQPVTPGQAQMRTHETSSGEHYFALSLTPDVQSPAERSVDIVIIFDTSASQTGLYRVEGIDALQALLGGLVGDVRAHLMAGDLRAVPMGEGFVASDSAKMTKAVEKLEQRAPLGSTDMNAVLRGALAAFPKNGKRSRQVVYLGDGLSRANLLETEEFGRLIKDLVAARVTVSSFVIGPQRDLSLLAALANHTGGNVYLDSSEGRIAQQAGLAMARVALGVVVWPTSTEVTPELPESYPSPMPPLRLDRDSILIGRLDSMEPLQLKVAAEVDGQPVALKWTVSPEPSDDEFGYLPRLVEDCRQNNGLTLATIGSSGLRQVGNQVLSTADSLADVGTRAMKTGDIEGARKIAESVLRRDPTNPKARAILRAIEKKEGQDDDESLIIGPKK